MATPRVIKKDSRSKTNKLLRVMTLLLIALLSTSRSLAQTKIPTVQVSPEAFSRIIAQVEKKKEDESRTHRSGPDFIDGVDVATHLSTSGGGDEAALVIFAVAGLVVMIAWIPYIPILLTDIIQGEHEDRKLRHLVSLHWGPLFGPMNSSRKEHARNGGLLGLRYSFFNEHLEEDRALKMGLGLEAGSYLVKEQKRLEGGYWLIGPSIIVGDLKAHELFGKVDLMGGTSFDAELGLISRAELSANWLLGPNFTLGVGLGGLYMKVKERHSLESRNDLSFIVGLNAGIVF